MKKKLLFVIPSLDAGGAEKSLINLLIQFDFQKYEVDLFLFKNSGLFLNSLPKEVKIISHQDCSVDFQLGILKSCLRYLSKFDFRLLKARIQFFLANRFIANKAVSEQKSWKYICKSIPTLDTKYDCAISYLEKSSLYFVVDKVNASNKIGWIHTNYATSGMKPEFDAPYFNNLNHIVTISEACVASLVHFFPRMERKISQIENIVSPKIIQDLAQLENDFKFDIQGVNILTVARLSTEKGIDLAVETCTILVKNNPTIKWFVIGDGPDRYNLEQQIKVNKLENNFFLFGLKANPYPYIKAATIYVQPSRYEGKSIAVDEAKILKKPIIVTNFSTAKDQIESGENGIITEMNPNALANSILQLIENRELMDKFSLNLGHEKLDNEDQIYKLYDLIDATK
ncbi:glycosyltransferase [Flavobacterium sp.]|uniref:glycosyltransferase n=1 Tax=Flavobacterium sp. TaxID=239 RepID=UPI00286D4B73|nr:glycosyltransferase [Flavobacterium sp.]